MPAMANITLTNQTNSPIRIDTTHFGVNVGVNATLVGTDLQIAEIYRDAGLGVIVPGVLPANTVAPAVTGTATVGQTLTTTNGTWTGTPTPTYGRVWQRSANGSTGWAAIASATGLTYVLAAPDSTQYVRCVVTATNGSGSAAVNSNVVGPIA